MVAKIANWLDERVGWKAVWETIFLRKIPKVNWFYTLGSATLFTAINQAVTGILLTIYYVPTPDHAYESVHGGIDSSSYVASDPHGRIQIPSRGDLVLWCFLAADRGWFWFHRLLTAMGPESILGLGGWFQHRWRRAGNRRLGLAGYAGRP
jgi:hypothetical protein